MNSIQSLLFSYLVNSLWQVPLLFLAAWLAARLLRPLGAAAEHCVWVIALLMQASLPAISILPWDWLQTLIGWATHSGTGQEGHVRVMIGAASTGGVVRLHARIFTAATSAYAAITVYFALRYLWRTWRLSTLRRDAVEFTLNDEAGRNWTRCLTRFSLSDVAIAASPRIFGPLTMGLRHKLVLLPVRMAADLSTADMHTVIAHELAHVHRKDFLKNLLYELIVLPINYHPLFWLTRERLIESREMVCDQLAAESAGRNEYARSLLRLASLLVQGTSARAPHAIGIFDANEFERRLMKLKENQKPVRGLSRFAIAAVCGVVAVVTCGSALALGTHFDAISAMPQEGSTQPPKKISVSSAVMAAQRISGSDPVYPEAAKKAKIQGKVVLQAVISAEGNVENLSVVSGPKELQASSLEAVKDWTYKPYLLNGEPVEVETTINVIYSLGG